MTTDRADRRTKRAAADELRADAGFRENRAPEARVGLPPAPGTTVPPT